MQKTPYSYEYTKMGVFPNIPRFAVNIPMIG